MSGVTPLNIIVRELKTLAQAHDQVRTFAYGHFLDVIKDNVVEYALVHVNIRSANKAENANTFSIELGVMDKTFKDDSNIQDVESNTYQIFIDLFNIISYSPRWQTLGVVTTPSNPQKFRYKGADEVTGWGGTIGFEIYEGLGFCDVPVTGYDYDAPVVPVLGPAKYQNSDLTFTQSIDAGDTYTAPDISFTDSDGVVSAVPANKNIVATLCGTTTYQAGVYTTGYAQGSGTIQQLDESDLSRETLLYNNEHGNKNRFTDSLGGQDWLSATNSGTDLRNGTQDHLTGLEWINRNAFYLGFSNSSWLNNLTNVNGATLLTKSDWRVPSIAEINTITNQANDPFNNGTYFRVTATVPTCSIRRDLATQYYRRDSAQSISTTGTGSGSTVVALFVRTM